MSFLGGPECSTAGNPLTQFTKHVQDDKSLQRDRLVGAGPGRMQESMRSRVMGGGQDQAINEFVEGQDPARFAEFDMRNQQPLAWAEQRNGPFRPMPDVNPARFDPGEFARFQQQFSNGNIDPEQFHRFQQQHPTGKIDVNEFLRFQEQNAVSQPGAATHTPPPMMAGYQRPMMGGYMGMGMVGPGMMGPAYGGPMTMHQQPVESSTQDKGKGRVAELDDEHWEAQFAQMDLADKQKDMDEEANAAMEKELNDLDRKLTEQSDEFEEIGNLHLGDANDWEGFDSLQPRFRDPQLGDYLFEEENMFRSVTNPFEEGMKIMREGGNLSLAALAFEAAVQKDPKHVEAWVMLGSAQAQNEKETAAIRALEQALQIDPNNLDALMGLAVSYTNEGYDTTAYRTLERWLSVKYPQIISPDELSQDADYGFTDRQLLHDRVTDLFIKAAQLSPSGEHMDPDVQVGLGVLFYCAEDYEKAVDCFSAALASTETGTSNKQDQVHLLWNRLGATLANSGRSEEAIEAYEKALNINPNFVRARYNLGVSCINIGCYEEAAQHLLGALAMHKVVEQQGREKAREIVGGPDGVDDAELERMIHISQNQSTNLYDTLRRVFTSMGRRDLADMVKTGMDVDVFRKEFDF
ncbi:hypothetical protein VTN49DRAFT_3243 [Thermomyces lanuginosus]|uniref:uncharacterized protein n=1 Tax=Thermomyces lanuginosus TaxID=5541 RepID=UPI0037440D13